MTAPQGSYPHELVGGHARPPKAPAANVVAMARDAQRRRLEAVGLAAPEPLGFVMPDWRLAGAVEELRNEANAANPGRDKASDGTIGDARHAGGGPGTPAWTQSDHNPWLVVAGKGVVRALDLDADGLDLPTAFERARALAHDGQLPELTDGGYLILNGRITAEDFSGWHAYKGTDPHVLHGHVSVSTRPEAFDARNPWGIFAPAPTPTPTPTPPAPKPDPDAWTGPDLTGRGPTLRGQAAGQPQGPQSNGPRVAELQRFLRDNFPLYAKGLADDGWYGVQTARVLVEFARRSGIKGADGLNIGPQTASALFRAGFDRSAAAQRVLTRLARVRV